MKYLLIICATLISCTEAANMPSYISHCCATAPNANKCIVKQANKILPLLLSGDEKYNLLCLLPYREARRNLLNNHDGQFILNSVRLYGLDTIHVKSVNVKFDKGTAVFQYHFVRLKIQFTYKINIFHTPLFGFGRGDIILRDGNITQSFNFTPDKEGYTYVNDAVVKYTASKTVYNLQNLREEAVEYLEDNYDQVNDLFRPNIGRFLRAVLTSPFRSIAELIKIHDILSFGSACNKN